MKTFVGVLLLCCLFSHGVRFLDDRADPEEAKTEKAKEEPAKTEKAEEGAENDKAAPEGEDAAPPMKGPAHSDNFQDEIVDQADPEFEMIAGGDGCISWEDQKNLFERQCQEGAPDRSTMTPEQLKEEEAIKKDILTDLKMMYEYADGIDQQDDCITKAEFKKAGEMEGPPPGFTKEKMNNNPVKDAAQAEQDFAEAMAEQDRYEFDAMDRSGDGKISRTEAYHYASENMPEADVDQASMDAMFDDTDKNGDGFITFDEFTGAGEAIEGDGNEMQDAVPMSSTETVTDPSGKSHEAPVKFYSMSFKMISKRKTSLRAAVTKKLLAHKPALKVTAHLLNMKEAGSFIQKDVDDEDAGEEEVEGHLNDEHSQGDADEEEVESTDEAEGQDEDVSFLQTGSDDEEEDDQEGEDVADADAADEDEDAADDGASADAAHSEELDEVLNADSKEEAELEGLDDADAAIVRDDSNEEEAVERIQAEESEEEEVEA